VTLSSDHSVKFVSLKDFLVEAELLLKKLLLCLERVIAGTLKRETGITLCY